MPSKLGPQFIGTPGFDRWQAAGVQVMKFDPGSLGASEQVPPGILVVGKLDQKDDNLKLTDWKAMMKQGKSPTEVADYRFGVQRSIHAGKNKPPVDRYDANPRIDVWEDDNEVIPDNAVEAKWYSDYCIAMMRHYESIGKKRANFSFATGTPDVRPGDPDDIWPHLLPAIRYARDNGHYIALHEYMGPYADLGFGHRQVDIHRRPKEGAWHGRTDAVGNPDVSYPYGLCPLRYRWIYDLYFRPNGLADTRLIITECGCDGVDPITPLDMESGSWTSLRDGYWQKQGLDANEHYASMLQWYDQRLREDDYVVGAQIFTIGSPGKGRWKDFDIAGTGVEERLLDYISAERGKKDKSAAQPPAQPVNTPLATPKPSPDPDGNGEPATKGHVNAPAGLNLRTEPTTSGGDATVIKLLQAGTQVSILDFDNGWYRVQAGDDVGYVAAVWVSPVRPDDGAKDFDSLLGAKEMAPPAVAPIVPSKAGHVIATAGLNLRSEPSTAGGNESIITLLPFGAPVLATGQVDGWYQVEADGRSGFVSREWITLGNPAPTGPGLKSAGFQPGMNINTGVHPPDIDRLRGLSWVRFVLIANDRNQSIDEAFHNTYEPLIRDYAAAGINSLIILNHETEHGNRPWTNKQWAAYAEPFGRAAGRAAALCAQFGDRVAFQIWNEQDSGWGSDAANKNPSAHGMPPEDFALLVDAASRHIRAAAPQAKIVTGGAKTGPENGAAYFLAAANRLGGNLPVDAIACHPYGRYVKTDPFYERRYGTLQSALAEYRRKLPRYPLWITEVGIVGGDKAIGPEHNGNIAQYMNEFVSEVANNHTGHVPVLIWFSWTDNMVNAGMLTGDNREKPEIYQAFQAMKARGVNGALAKGMDDGLGKGLEAFLESATAEMVRVTAPAGLNLRTEPGTGKGEASIVTRLLEGTELEVLERLPGWLHVRAGELEGYVSAEWVTPIAGLSPTAPPRTPGVIRKSKSVVGIHGAPGGAAPPRDKWEMWTDLLKDMGIRWYKQCETGDGTGEGSIFQWVLHLKRNGIEPIVRFLQGQQFPNHLDDSFFRQMQRYANEGVRWVEIGNEPNLRYEWQDSWQGRYEGKWPNGHWNPEPRMRVGNPESSEVLAKLWVEDATRSAEMGAWPAFYAFGPTDWGNERPNGLYSSTLFTELVVARLASHHRAETIRLFKERNAWIAVHVAKYEKDLSYNPYSDNPNKPWDMSLRGYEVVLKAFQKHFGRDLNVSEIPIISTEGGVFVPEHRNSIETPGRLPDNDEEHAHQIIEMYRYVEQNTPLTAMCPWCISESDFIGHRTHEFLDHGWFKQVGNQLVNRPVYEAMQRLNREKNGGLESMNGSKSADEILGTPVVPSVETSRTITLNVQIKITVDGLPETAVVEVVPELN